MMMTRRRMTVFAAIFAAAAAAAVTATMLLGDAGASAANASAADASAADAVPADPDRIAVEGAWRAIAPGESQTIDEVRCPGTHPYVFNELFGARPRLLTPGVEVLVAGGRAGDLTVDVRSVLTRLEDRTATGVGPAGRNRVTLSGGGEAATYRVDVHCTSDLQDSYA